VGPPNSRSVTIAEHCDKNAREPPRNLRSAKG
jgi:hypothetical protein